MEGNKHAMSNYYWGVQQPRNIYYPCYPYPYMPIYQQAYYYPTPNVPRPLITNAYQATEYNHYGYTGPDLIEEGVPNMTATHIHEFLGETTRNEDHEHKYAGTTEPGANGTQHIHKYWAVSQYDDKHRHLLIGESGPAIPLPDGGHIHALNGETVGYPNHQHGYSTKTEEE